MVRQSFLMIIFLLLVCACQPGKKGVSGKLGPVLLNKTILGGAFGSGPNGEQWGYSVATGETGVFYAFDVITGKQTASFTLPNAGGSWGMEVAANGDVYIGTWPNALLYRYVPGSQVVECLGQPPGFEGEPFAIWRIVTDNEGNVYGGVSGSRPNDGRAFRYDTKAKTFIDYGVACIGNGTVRSVAYHDGYLYAGTGPSECRLAKINVKTGEKREIPLPEPHRKRQYIYDAQVLDEMLLIRTEPAKTLLVYDLNKDRWVDEQKNVTGFDFAPSDGTDTWLIKNDLLQRYSLKTFKLTPTGFSVRDVRGLDWIEVDNSSYPGKSLVSLTPTGDAWIYNPQTNAVRHFTPEIDPQPVTLRSLGRGPDGHIYASSYLSGGLSKYNTTTGEMEQYPRGVGQAGSIISDGNKLILGIYPSARLLTFDPAQAFNYGNNPVDHLNLAEHRQDRVFALAPVNGKIAMGTVAAAGARGGALTIFDPENRTWDVYRPIPGQSIISLAYDGRGILYCGSSNGIVFAWDVEKSEVLWEVNPGMGKISSLLLSEQGTLWSMTGTGCIIEVNPAERKVTRCKCLFPDAAWNNKIDALLRNSRLIMHPNGLLYGTAFGYLFSANPVTLEHEVLEENAYLLEQDMDGKIYYTFGADLFIYEPAR